MNLVKVDAEVTGSNVVLTRDLIRQNFIQTLLRNSHTHSSHLLQHPLKPPPVTAKTEALNSSEIPKQTLLLSLKVRKMPLTFFLFHHLKIRGRFIIAHKRCFLCVLFGYFRENLIF